MDKELFCMVPSDRNGAGRQFLVGRVRYWGSLGIAHHEVVTYLRGAVLSGCARRGPYSQRAVDANVRLQD